MTRVGRLMAIVLVCGVSTGAGAQCADTLVRLVSARTDSLREETLRRSATTGRYLAPRATEVRRHAAAIDTHLARCGVATGTVTVTFGTTTTTRWTSGAIGRYDTGDSVTVCAVVQVGDAASRMYRLGTPYVVARAVHNDSVVWRVVTPPALGELREHCRRAWEPSFGNLPTALAFPVVWEALRVQPFTLALPFAKPAPPVP